MAKDVAISEIGKGAAYGSYRAAELEQLLFQDFFEPREKAR
jgi:hypothetical protein